MRSLVRARLLSNAVVNAGAINALTFTASSRAIHHLLTSPRQVRAMAQRSVSRIQEGDLPLQDANGAGWIRKPLVSTVLSYRFSSYVSAKTRRDKKLISKRQVARLFGVSMRTIDCWLHDGKLPEPKRTFPRQKWDYRELVVRTRLKVSVHR